MDIPQTLYASSGDLHIAYQVFGNGPLELVYVGGPANHVEIVWEEPRMVRVLERLGSFARVICFDRRGTGLSDPVTVAPTLEQYMEDMAAVVEAAGVTHPHALLGGSEAGRMCLLYAATFPERVSAVALHGTSPYGAVVLDPGRQQRILEVIERSWGRGDMLELFAPSALGDARARAYMGRIERYSAPPGMARRLLELSVQTDVRPILGAVRVPVLVVAREHDPFAPLGAAQEMVEALPDGRLVQLPGDENVPWLGDADALLDEIEEFLTGQRPHREPDRVLATVLFTDICGSTAKAAELGDRAWRELLAEHDRRIRDELDRFRGREVKTLGDGFLATFDGPARAVRCAEAIARAVRDLGVEIRAGLHTGEIEVLPADVSGLAVDIAERISDIATRSEVLVSGTVHDLVVGSGLRFEDRGARTLPGVADEWRLYAVTPNGA
jgi:class 3 adenylate cyclase